MGNEMEKRRPSGKWYILSGVLFVVSLGLTAYGFMGIFRPIYQEKQTFNIPASGETFTINDPGVYNVSYESTFPVIGFMDNKLNIKIGKRPANSSGETPFKRIELKRVSMDYKYASPNACGQVLWDFSIDGPSELEITVTAKPDDRLPTGLGKPEAEEGRIAIQKEIGWKNMIMSIVAIATGGLMFIGSLVVSSVVLILRITRKNPSPIV